MIEFLNWKFSKRKNGASIPKIIPNEIVKLIVCVLSRKSKRLLVRYVKITLINKKNDKGK